MSKPACALRADRRAPLLAVCAIFCVGLGAGCDPGPSRSDAAIAVGGDADRGERIIRAAGCGACHTIDGVRGATGLVGPSLSNLADRAYIAGVLTNTPENAVRWIMDPQAIQPRTAMPDLGLSDAQARDVVTYLYGPE